MDNSQSKYVIGAPHPGVRHSRERLVALAAGPALFAMLPLRSRPGLRRLSLPTVGGTGFLMYCGHLIANFHIALPLIGAIGATGYSESLRNADFLFVSFACIEHRKRWKELRSGIRWHGYSPGISRFEWLPIRRDLVYRLVDPGVAFLAGMCLRKLGFGALGLWTMFCAICLAIVEAYAHEKALERDLDTLDSILEAEVQGATVAHFEGQAASAQTKARSLKETSGIPTGADAGLEAEIAKRRKEAAEARS